MIFFLQKKVLFYEFDLLWPIRDLFAHIQQE